MLKKRNNFLPSQIILTNLLQRFQQLIAPILKPNIAIYYPNGSELNILPFIKTLSSESFKISLPVINKNSNINFYQWKIGEELFVSKFANNILEPKIAKIIIPDVIIMPLIACDLSGISAP